MLAYPRRLSYHLRVLWTVAPGWSVASLLGTLLSAGMVVATMITVGGLTGSLASAVHDGWGSGSAATFWRWFVAFAVLQVGQWLNVVEIPYAAVTARYYRGISDLVADTALAPRSLAAVEDPVIAGRLRAAVAATRDWVFPRGVAGGWEVLQTRLGGLGALVLVWAYGWRWWVPPLVALGFWLSGRSVSSFIDTIISREVKQEADDGARAQYARGLLASQASAKEVRLFGLAGWLRQRYSELWHAANTAIWASAGRALWPVVRWVGVLTVVEGVALALLAYDVHAGHVPLGSGVVLALALLGLSGFGAIGDPQTGLLRLLNVLDELVGMRRELGLPALRSTAPIPAQDQEQTALEQWNGANSDGDRALAITFDHVGFGYPRADRDVLADVHVRIPAGQSVALVGVNGAGKSTMIKLLTGLYAPDRGHIRVGDHDAAAGGAGRVGVIFQEFVHYPLSLRDNVGLGSPQLLADAEQAPDALPRALAAAGAEEIAAKLDHGWETVLSSEFDEGAELSGGQWQRVALARALFAVAGGAGVLVLDEPTAALDVRAEAELFERFLEVTTGVTTILVTHRLSSVRHVERILVLDGATGMITEDGSHDELLAADGAYAAMFRLQAERFARAGSEGES